MSQADVAHRILRAGIFERSMVWRALFAAKGYDYSPADVVEFAHRRKAWLSLRGRLGRRALALSREGFRERITERIRELPQETVLNFFDQLVFLPTGRTPFDLAADTAWDWDSWLRQGGVDLSADVLQRLLGVLGELVDEFLAQLQQTGKFEIPPPILTFTPQGGLPEGATVGEVGQSVAIEVIVGASETRTRASRSVSGPVVVERVQVLISVAGNGTVQVMAVPAGSSYPFTAGFDDVGGVPLFEVTASGGAQSSQLPVSGAGLAAEFWPRKAIGLGAVRFVLTGKDLAAAGRTFLALVDTREVVASRIS